MSPNSFLSGPQIIIVDEGQPPQVLAVEEQKVESKQHQAVRL